MRPLEAGVHGTASSGGGRLCAWANPLTILRTLKIFDLRLDPCEQADVTSKTYYDWLMNHVFLFVPDQD
jgi:hypothetical protein